MGEVEENSFEATKGRDYGCLAEILPEGWDPERAVSKLTDPATRKYGEGMVSAKRGSDLKARRSRTSAPPTTEYNVWWSTGSETETGCKLVVRVNMENRGAEDELDNCSWISCGCAVDQRYWKVRLGAEEGKAKICGHLAGVLLLGRRSRMKISGEARPSVSREGEVRAAKRAASRDREKNVRFATTTAVKVDASTQTTSTVRTSGRVGFD